MIIFTLFSAGQHNYYSRIVFERYRFKNRKACGGAAPTRNQVALLGQFDEFVSAE
ncbi:MAG: hypothetical protein ACREOI_32110 [bacterium]